MSNEFSKYLSTKDVSRISKVDLDVVRRHIRLGRLKTEQFSSRGAHMIHRDEFSTWLKNVVMLSEKEADNISTTL
nr:hypothetical protein [uncultured Mediterranean phage uvMED]